MTDISAADAELEYQAFLKAIRNRQDVWTLQLDEGLATWSSDDEGGPITVPFWSSHAQAHACGIKSFPGYSPCPISANEFLNVWLPRIKEKGMFIGANMTYTMAGVDVAVDHLLRDLDPSGG